MHNQASDSNSFDSGSRRPIVFIGGLHRSGTSLLFRILRDHPEISGFRNTGVPENEGQHLQSVYPAAKHLGGPGVFGFHPEAPLDEKSPLVSPQNAEKLFREWSTHWDLSRKLLAEKSPPNLLRTRFLQTLFPLSRFIIILRHPIAVSYATKKFSRQSIPELIEHWLVCHERFLFDQKYLKQCLIIHYEELVGSSRSTLEGIYRFLAISASDLRQEIRPGLNTGYLGQFKQSHTKIEIAAMVEKFNSRITALGYDLAD